MEPVHTLMGSFYPREASPRSGGGGRLGVVTAGSDRYFKHTNCYSRTRRVLLPVHSSFCSLHFLVARKASCVFFVVSFALQIFLIKL